MRPAATSLASNFLTRGAYRTAPSRIPSSRAAHPRVSRRPAFDVRAMTTSEGDPAPAPASSSAAAGAPAPNPIVQYVVLRRDLGQGMGWPLGSICAQAAHAAVAAVWEHREHADTVAYCAPDAIDGMHKVVLEVKGETQLVNLAAKLAEAGVDHKLWLEQPENFPTCLATRPYPKSEVAAHFKKCNLAKGVIAAPTAQ